MQDNSKSGLPKPKEKTPSEIREELTLKLNGVVISNKRQPGESFEDYKKRRKETKEVINKLKK